MEVKYVVVLGKGHSPLSRRVGLRAVEPTRRVHLTVSVKFQLL